MNIYKVAEYGSCTYPGKYNNKQSILTDETTGQTYIVCKKCKCCYSIDGEYCYISDKNKQYIDDLENKLFEYKSTAYPGKYNDAIPVIQSNKTGDTFNVCKKCKCCYSPGGQFCEVSYVANGNKLFTYNMSVPHMFNGHFFSSKLNNK